MLLSIVPEIIELKVTTRESMLFVDFLPEVESAEACLIAWPPGKPQVAEIYDILPSDSRLVLTKQGRC